MAKKISVLDNRKFSRRLNGVSERDVEVIFVLINDGRLESSTDIQIGFA